MFSLSIWNTVQGDKIKKLIATDWEIIEKDEPHIEAPAQITQGLSEELVRGQSRLQATVEK